jgi:hypothetical protein
MCVFSFHSGIDPCGSFNIHLKLNNKSREKESVLQASTLNFYNPVELLNFAAHFYTETD